MNVTIQFLEDIDACHTDRTDFAELFGREAELTKENLVRALDRGLDVKWLCIEVYTLLKVHRYGRPGQEENEEWRRLARDYQQLWGRVDKEQEAWWAYVTENEPRFDDDRSYPEKFLAYTAWRRSPEYEGAVGASRERYASAYYLFLASWLGEAQQIFKGRRAHWTP